MSNITTVGLDLAKSVSHVVCCNQVGKIVRKKVLKRNQVLSFFRELTPCIVGIESCASAHFWAREIAKCGHQVKQLAPQHVKAYVRGNKTDFNDALAIAEAVVRPEMRIVRTKTLTQQDIQALHVMRKRPNRQLQRNTRVIV